MRLRRKEREQSSREGAPGAKATPLVLPDPFAPVMDGFRPDCSLRRERRQSLFIDGRGHGALAKWC
jgi:hypothetical protein